MVSPSISSESPKLSETQRLIQTLGGDGLDRTGREIAEIIWLATKFASARGDRDRPERPVEPDRDSGGEQDSEANQAEESSEKPPTKEKPREMREPTADLLPPSLESSPSLALPDRFKPIPVPDAPVITRTLQLARALRPFARPVEVGMTEDIDEAATVEQIAETGVWKPVVKPAYELWLDVALVFDASPSMAIWQKVDRELQRLFSRYGVFRDVRTWRLRPTPNGLQFTTGRGVPRKPRELLTGDRRRLVVVVSDCVGVSWYNGQMREIIGIWSKELPTVILQVFPDRLWTRTALARSIIARLEGKEAGLPSDRLLPTTRSPRNRERLARRTSEQPILPVVGIEPEAFANLAAVVTGKIGARVLGIVWDAEPVNPVNNPEEEALEDIIDSFMMLASLTARELASLLVSAPVITLPIVRLIRSSMLPHAEAAHIAEVLMSGLFKLAGNDRPTYDNAERLSYQIIAEEVRDRLRAGTRIKDARDVVKAVSDYVAEGLGKSFDDFWALLFVPGEDIPAEETRFLQAFATVTARVLRGLGGEFTGIANNLERGQREAKREAGEKAFLDRFTPRTTSIKIGRLTILEGEAETEFIALREQCASLNLEDGALYELQLTAIESGIEELEARTIFIYNRIAERQNLPEWSGETVFVDRRGEIIKSQPVTAKYYEEEIPFNKRKDQPPQELTRIKMLLIPGGTLLKDGQLIYIKPFFMAQTPITQAQWWAIASRKDLKIKNSLNLTPSNFKDDYQETRPSSDWLRGIIDYSETSHWLRPVESVSWYDAIEFCGRLAKLTGSLYALPSEAQWEYACHGFRQPRDPYPPFHYGETLTGKLANYDSQETYADEEKTASPRQTTPVGNYPPNAFGLQDLHGNVWEWCMDLWDSTEISIAENAPPVIEDNSINLLDKNITMQLLKDKGARVIRGGSWFNDPGVCRGADRLRDNPADRSNVVNGFRVVCRFPRL